MDVYASDADELYVLGDLFEAWIGDDALNPMSERVIQAFAEYSSTSALYFMHGNRDFLISDSFINKTGGRLLTEPYFVSLADQKSCLMHGDSLCTDDIEYQAFRTQVRSKEWQKDFLSKPIEERQAIANHIRAESKAKGQAMTEEIGDVNQSAVSQFMKDNEVTLLIHGHTHRQNRHPLTINETASERIVLGDWGETGSVLIIEDGNIQLQNFSIT